MLLINIPICVVVAEQSSYSLSNTLDFNSVKKIEISKLKANTSTKKNKKSKKKEEIKEEPLLDEFTDEKTAISISSDTKKNKSYTYFSLVDESLLTEIENGSPNSLRNAVSILRQKSTEYSEPEKVLFVIAYNIMQLLWPTQRLEWETPSVSGENAYLGAINSAKNGVYDTSTGNVDFLTWVLPSLVITKTNNIDDFFVISEEALKKGLELNQDSVLANYLLGLLYKSAKKNKDALPYLKKAAQNSQETIEAVFSYADCLFLCDLDKEAMEQIELLLQKYSQNLNVLKLASNFFYKQKNYDLAEEYISKALLQDSNDLPSILFRARILIDKKDFIHAASLLDIYSRQENTSKNYLLLRSQIQFEWSKNVTGSISTIESALRAYPDDKDVMLYAAKLSAQTGLLVAGKAAGEYAEEVLKEEPENEIALQYAVQGFIQTENWQKAYEVSSSLISKSKDSLELIFHHIKICISLKKYDEAWNLIVPLYKANSKNEDIVTNYIWVMVESGKNVQALTLINQLLPESASKLKSFLYYERSYLQQSEEASLSDLRSSLIANPRNSDSLFRLYKIYFNKKDYRKAQYYLKQVVAINPNEKKYRQLNEDLMLLLK